MSLTSCFQRAVQMGVLSREEGDMLRRRYDGMIKDGLSNVQARDRMAQQIKAEADQRERAALMTHFVVDRMWMQMGQWRDHKGRRDMPTAFVNMHENMGDHGSFLQDAEGLRDVITREAMSELTDIMRELRRGAFLGDLRRSLNPKVKARADNIVREIHGQDTGDTKAKIIADAVSQTLEKLRVRFNEAGGAIGKIQGGYLPQSHDALALLDFKRKPWVEFMMEKGRLDRDRMVHQATGEKLSDSELRDALGTAWDRITTNGYYDIDVTAASQGKGALYTQHMDHRFIHFATPDKFLEYSKRFGNGGDVYASIMGHIQIMARDIAHMEAFGPNPNRTREFVKTKLKAAAGKSKSNAVVIAEQTDELKRLTNEMNRNTPKYEALLDRHAEILQDIDKLRWSTDHNAFMIQTQIRPKDGIDGKAKTYRDTYDTAIAELQAIQEQLTAFDRGEKSKTVTDPAIEAEFQWLLTHMRETMDVASHKDGNRAIAWVNKKIDRADAMWDAMRGGEVGDPVWAARMQSIRNVTASASLGSAVFSSLTDPAWGQDLRLRLGMGIARSNFARIVIANLREMITMGSREDAIAAGLGLDSSLRVLHRQAKEAAGIDHKFWSAYVTDRVLTTGMLLPWTQAGKHFVGLDLMRFFGELASKPWDAIPEGSRKMLVQNGISYKDWSQLRTVPKHENLWLRPNEVVGLDRDLGERYLQMILRATRHAVPEATIASSTLLNPGKAGTLGGEAMRSMLQFKGFSFGMMMLHPLRIAREFGAGDARMTTAGYAATMFITSAMLGMVALALKDVKDGRDPRKWLDEKTWLDPFYVSEAILQAGGLGIFGDFIRASENRMGGGLAGTIAGPLAGKLENAIKVASPGQIGKYIRGKEITSEEEAVRFFRSGAVPFSNHPLLAATFQRVIMDQIQLMLDPKGHQAHARSINSRMRDYGQGYWWQPGTTSPQRAPDLTRPFATR